MDLEQTAIGRIKIASEMSLNFYQQPITVCVSGGKDSDVLLELVRRSGVPFRIKHSLTTVDAPQTVQHVRDIFKRFEAVGVSCVLDKPPLNMWQLIVKKGVPPTRLMRYCCEILKENNSRNCHILTGVRWAESTKRKTRGIYEGVHKDREKRVILMDDNDDRRRLTERCQMLATTVTNPIIDWKDQDVFSYIESERIPLNPLYSMGFCRVGCIGCPMAGKRRYQEFELFPTYKRAYIRAFDRMVDARKAAGKETADIWRDGLRVYRWWMEEKIHPDQVSMFDEVNDAFDDL